ncbi:hypothetical protein D3C76_1867550 [compost metagenome]
MGQRLVHLLHRVNFPFAHAVLQRFRADVNELYFIRQTEDAVRNGFPDPNTCNLLNSII